MSGDPDAGIVEAGGVEVDFWDVFRGEHDYWQQEDFVTGSSARHQLFCGARGTGKSVGLTLKALYMALRNPGRRRPDGSMIYCPGALMGRTRSEIDSKLEPTLQGHFDRWRAKTGFDLVADYSAKHQTYTLINGARILKIPYGVMKSLKGCRGYDLGWIALDESEHAEVSSVAAWNILLPTLRAPVATEPCFAIATTPDGMRGIPRTFVEAWRANNPAYYTMKATVYDNPYVDDAFRESLRLGCSPRMWAQEGLGQILRPVEVVYVEYEEDVHVVPWEWDSRLPYILGIDWGANNGYVCAIQFVPPREDQFVARNKLRLFSGDWVVAREVKMEDGSPFRMRQEIMQLVKSIGYPPYMTGSDRAEPLENDWLDRMFGHVAEGGVHAFSGKQQQLRKWGIGAVSSMLNSAADGRIRLFFADTLDNSLSEVGRGIRPAMANYCYLKVRLDSGELMVSNRPEENTCNAHPCDGLRYAVGVSVDDPYCHGGAPLPYVSTHGQDLQDAA